MTIISALRILETFVRYLRNFRTKIVFLRNQKILTKLLTQIQATNQPCNKINSHFLQKLLITVIKEKK